MLAVNHCPVDAVHALFPYETRVVTWHDCCWEGGSVFDNSNDHNEIVKQHHFRLASIFAGMTIYGAWYPKYEIIGLRIPCCHMLRLAITWTCQTCCSWSDLSQPTDASFFGVGVGWDALVPATDIQFLKKQGKVLCQAKWKLKIGLPSTIELLVPETATEI